jgi:hypothetical protein
MCRSQENDVDKNEGYFDARCSFKDDYRNRETRQYLLWSYLLNVFFSFNTYDYLSSRCFFQNDIWGDIDDALSFCFFSFLPCLEWNLIFNISYPGLITNIKCAFYIWNRWETWERNTIGQKIVKRKIDEFLLGLFLEYIQNIYVSDLYPPLS